METAGIGIVGCGNISPIYLQNLSRFSSTNIVAVADLDLNRAKARATEYGIATATDFDSLLDDPKVEVIVNLTTPLGHYEVAKRALLAGKHVYNEKPITIDVCDADELMNLAAKQGVLIGCAPDTVLGAGIQTCREILDSGLIGVPLAFQAFMMCPGHEGWHPDPEFYYQKGGGPLFDMGPYYMSALVTLLGPVKTVCGYAKKSFETRTIKSTPKNGELIHVEVPTHLVTAMEFANGATGQLTTSFDVQFHSLPHIEIYGEKGTIRVPDPNGFGGPVFVKTVGDADWREVPLGRPYAENARGLGVLDLVLASREGRPPRASGAIARHILSVFHAAHSAPFSKTYVQIESVERPMAMPNEALE